MIINCSNEMSSSIFFQSHPYIHVHHWEKDAFYKNQGWVETEICCHSCHKSLKILFTHIVDVPKDGISVLKDISDHFIHQHSDCKHIDYSNFCPSVRFETDILDLRGVNLLEMEEAYV